MERSNGMCCDHSQAYNCVVITDLRIIGGSLAFVAWTISGDTSHGDMYRIPLSLMSWKESEIYVRKLSEKVMKSHEMLVEQTLQMG